MYALLMIVATQFGAVTTALPGLYDKRACQEAGTAWMAAVGHVSANGQTYQFICVKQTPV